MSELQRRRIIVCALFIVSALCCTMNVSLLSGVAVGENNFHLFKVYFWSTFLSAGIVSALASSGIATRLRTRTKTFIILHSCFLSLLILAVFVLYDAIIGPDAPDQFDWQTQSLSEFFGIVRYTALMIFMFGAIPVLLWGVLTGLDLLILQRRWFRTNDNHEV